ncbi:MAG: hypothetical protein FJ116_06130 [Deltaproteobacteria bacterium]|nr:hypothetical protein [Deltaproteobacteria bacterium]
MQDINNLKFEEQLLHLAELAVSDPQFRADALQDLDKTIEKRGFNLSTEERATLKKFHTQISSMTEEEMDTFLESAVEGQVGT